jgi:hypothetical protein
MKSLLLLLVAFALAVTEAFGTAQYPDLIEIDGDEQSMHCNPLESYFETFPEKRPRSEIMSTALWRGYVAHFGLRDNALWVRDIKIQIRKKGSDHLETEWRSVIKETIPEDADRKATWFTGFLILPRGKMTEYVHMGYASSYEEYQLIFVHAGRVMANRIFTAEEYTEYKRLQFEAFAKTERYQAMKKELEAKYGSDSYLTPESFLFIFDVTFPREVLIDYKDFRPNQ